MKEITIGQVVDQLIEEYETAKKKDYIEKPMAFSLYRIWRTVDETEHVKRKVEE